MRCLLGLWLALLASCSAAPHVVRFRNAAGATWTYQPTRRAEPIVISDQQYQVAIQALSAGVPPWTRPLEDARHFFGIPERSGTFLYEVRTRRLIPEEEGGPMDEVSIEKWVADYKAWCAGTKLGTGDCLGILIDGKLTSHGRYVLALWISRGEVLEAALESARQSGRPKEVLIALACATGMYFMLWALPEPASKGAAAVITIGLIGYLGVDTVLSLGTAFEQLVRESDQARDFAALREAGQRFGKVFGENAARALVSLAAAAIGRTGGELISKLASLPRANQLFKVVLEQGGLDLAAAGTLETVVVSPGAVSISLTAGSTLMASATQLGTGHPLAEVPQASNPKLQNTLRELFRDSDKIPGGTAGAVRHELKTGELVGGKSHLQKGRERVVRLERILAQENLSPDDRALAERILHDLREALAGR